MKDKKIYYLVLNALFIALVFLATEFVQIRLPISINGGLVHLGTAALFIIALNFGPKCGAIAGAFGMALFDIFSGWLLWAPFTFVGRGIMGYIIGRMNPPEKKKNPGMMVLSIIISSAVMIGVYYICEGVLYGNWVAPVNSIPGNLMQVVIGTAVAFPVTAVMEKTGLKRTYIKYI